MSTIKERQIAKGDLGTKRMYEKLDAKAKVIEYIELMSKDNIKFILEKYGVDHKKIRKMVK